MFLFSFITKTLCLLQQNIWISAKAFPVIVFLVKILQQNDWGVERSKVKRSNWEIKNYFCKKSSSDRNYFYKKVQKIEKTLGSTGPFWSLE